MPPSAPRLLLAAISTAAASQNASLPTVRKDMLFRQAPFLMAHDAATGYCGKADPLRPFVQTQVVVPFDQMTCGARAFDVRLVVSDDGAAHFHHGKWVSTDQTFQSEGPVFVDWARKHPSELIVMLLSHCYTRTGFLDLDWKPLDCRDDRVLSVVRKAGIPVETDCGTVDGWTVAAAERRGAMNGGGKMIAVLGEGYCLTANYDKSVDARGKVKGYVNRTMAAERGAGNIFSVQAFVQQTFEVPLKDSAELNPEILDWISGGLLRGINLLEVNLVCQRGQAISAALGAHVSDADKQMCTNACKKCEYDGCSPTTVSSTGIEFLV